MKDVKRSRITQPRRNKANNAVVFATPVQKIRAWGLPDHIKDFLEPSRFQPRVFGDFIVRKKSKITQVAAQVAKARQCVKTDAKQLALSLPQEAPAIVDANAAALPIRVQEIHVSHQTLLVEGVVGYRRCHSIIGKQKLSAQRWPESVLALHSSPTISGAASTESNLVGALINATISCLTD